MNSIDNYYQIFYENLCYEIDPSPSPFSGGGTMSCPSQTVDNRKSKIDENLTLTRKLGIELAPAILKFYSQLAWMEISWRPSIHYFNTPIELLKEDADRYPQAKEDIKKSICENKPPLRGHLRIELLTNLIHGPKEKKWEDILWFGHMEDDVKKLWQQYMVFDWSVPECSVLLKKENNRIEDRLYFHYVDNEDPVDLGIGIEKYLMMAYKVKAFEGWQYALAKHPGDNGLTLKRMKHYLPQIFPKLSFDFSDFE